MAEEYIPFLKIPYGYSILTPTPPSYLDWEFPWLRLWGIGAI